jgi:magnesium transporter
MAALTPSEEPYLKTKVITLSKNRAPWLLVLMLTATVTSAIIESYEDALTVMPALVAFIPMLMDTGGNAGAQTSTLVIRGMALGEILTKDIAKILWREICVGIICGGVLGIINFIRVYVMNERDIMLSLTVTLSLIFTVIVAKITGCTLPILAKKIGIDPAVCAAPVLTSIVDAAALIFYFSMARVLLGI